MRFILTQKACIATMQSQNSVPGTLPFTVAVKPNMIVPVDDQGNAGEGEEHCVKLRDRLFGRFFLDEDEGGNPVAWLQWEMLTIQVILVDGSGGSRSVGLRIMSGPVTNALIELFGFDVKIQMTFDMLCCQDHGCFSQGVRLSYESAKSKEMKVKSGRDYACKDKKVFRNLSSTRNMETVVSRGKNFKFSGQLTITVIVDEGSGPMVDDKLQVLRKMLHEELGSDLTILLENGKQVKAHKAVLLAHSDVFKAMFQNDMKEVQTHSVEIPEMSEEGVRGLLAYLYCWEEEEPNAKPLVAFEMLQAGHKYDIPVLEAAMKKLLLAKPTKWFDGDVALKLFLLAKKLPEIDGYHLKMKAVKIMKTHFENFKKTDAYISLFKEEPDMAMEICSHFAAV